ncbi:hypothetical protein BD413DRAFT_610099 [Trametes elegans]|nr:hypothetical protein BD413DRAFT_610099 [Trametes elegans]
MPYEHFSWSDTFQAALSSCLPCLKSADGPSDAEDNQTPRPRPGHTLSGALTHGIIPPPRARPDELEGLLADASDDAETLSLHSNPGRNRRRRGAKDRRKKTKRAAGAPKHIRVFGFDLFGRAPAIQLPPSDDEGEGPNADGESRRPRTISTDTLDSDAAPLDADAIQALSAARHAEAVAREEEERRRKEERRRVRRERRELKRAAMAHALALQHANGDEEFEGFQGSGPAPPFGGAPFSPSLGSGSGSLSLSVSDSQDFGPFAQGQLARPFDADAALAAEAESAGRDGDADGADFGAESYTRRPRHGSKARAGGSGGTQTTSDTRSSGTRRTGSDSYAFATPYNHQFLAQQQQQQYQPQTSPLSPYTQSDGVPPSPGAPAPVNGAQNKQKKKHRRRSTRAEPTSASVTGSGSGSSPSATASQTASLVSPPPSEPAPRVFTPADGFEGFPGALGGHAPHPDAGAAFPSVGLRGIERTKSDMGVFLARRGDE